MRATDYDDVTLFLGEWGPFQKRVAFILCTSVFTSGLGIVSIVFLADTPMHHCAIPPNVNISAEWRNYSIPLEEDNGVMRSSKCTRYKLDVIELLSKNGYVPGVDVNVTEIEQESCKDGWEYDKSIYVSTIVSEWDLVCSHAWKVPMTTSIFFLGVITGSMISGQLSDRFGRKIILFVTVGVQAFFTFCQSFSKSWLLFSALFFLVGCGIISHFATAFVLGAEIMSPRIRIIYSTVGVSIFFAIGMTSLSPMAFLTRDWRRLLLAMAVPGVAFLPFWRLIPESPRWLIAQGRVEEAEAILRAAAKKNRVKAPEVIFQPLQVKDQVETSKNTTICDLVKSSNIRWITVILGFVWMIISLGYFAVALNTTSLHGDRFLNFFFSGAVEVPAYILSWILFRFCSRRWCLFAMLFLCGTVLLVTQIIPKNFSSVSTALEMVGKFGATVAFALVYAITPELYPTVLRNSALGVGSLASRVGGISAPYFLYLGAYYKSLPYILIGSLCVFGGVLTLLLPETFGMPLPETIDQMQRIQRCKKRRQEI